MAYFSDEPPLGAAPMRGNRALLKILPTRAGGKRAFTAPLSPAAWRGLLLWARLSNAPLLTSAVWAGGLWLPAALVTLDFRVQTVGEDLRQPWRTPRGS